LSKDFRAIELLKRTEMNYDNLMSLENVGPGCVDKKVSEQVEIQTKYEGYVTRQEEEIARLKHYEETSFPRNFDYNDVHGLSNEVKQKLIESRPGTIGQASRVPGITPAAVSLLLVYLKKSRFHQSTQTFKRIIFTLHWDQN